ncbi:MAG: quinone oxidoreductase [Alphaproteobacteria bacterium]|nr:quinone oxidoreductase [Alphaproteobacteria bacterium]MDB5720175.1 quinone oxidoreductase [Alphaproteobacteria bacterium]
MSHPYRIAFRRPGGPEVLEHEAVTLPEPAPGEVRIHQEAVGLNFIDTYHRSGLYPIRLPSGLGNEAAGVVEAVGEGVTDICRGDRVGYFTGALGAYASHRNMPSGLLVRLPSWIGAEQAAATMLKGCTAEYLIERCARVQAGQWVLVYAAAGGVGSILVPWLKSVGARVIAYSGNEAKAELAFRLGAEDSLCGPLEEIAAEVRRLTDGAGADVIFDGVGAETWQVSLASVARRGLVVTYGNASGPVPAFTALDLLRAGSIFVTRPTLGDYVTTVETMRTSADRLFTMMRNHVVKVHIGARFLLAEADEAHRAIESRATTGSTILIP